MTEANDILIVGAGPVGAVCALAMQQQGLVPRILEARARAGSADARTLALSHGSRLILERLGVWSQLEPVTPITRIHISQRGGLGVANLSAEEERLPALGYVLSYATLATALESALARAGIAVDYGVSVERVTADESMATLHATQGPSLSAPLVVVADGGRGTQSPSPRLARDYGQMAIVCEVKTELPHGNRAFERFTPDGPAALLPKGDRYALVWTTHPDEAERVAALNDADFLDALYRHFGGRQGRFLSATPRNCFPLTLRYSGTRTGVREVRIGNAAHTLHPVSGQGFNIGLRDAWELAVLCGDMPRASLGTAAMLAAYARSRRIDVLGGLGFTDFLVRVFSNDLPPLRHARGLGLMALELVPPLKHFVARRMIFGARG